MQSELKNCEYVVYYSCIFYLGSRILTPQGVCRQGSRGFPAFSLRSGNFNWRDSFGLTIPFWWLCFKQTERKKKAKRMRLATLCIILTHFYWVFVLSLPKLGHWNMSWLSFLAESVISDRPPCGRMPRPTGDPCSCKTAGSGPCLKETVHQRGCLASLHLSASSTTPPPYRAENLCWAAQLQNPLRSAVRKRMLIRDVGRNKPSECKVQPGSGFTERLHLAFLRG